MTMQEKQQELQARRADLQRKIQHHTQQRDAHAQEIGRLSVELLKVEGGLAALSEVQPESGKGE